MNASMRKRIGIILLVTAVLSLCLGSAVVLAEHPWQDSGVVPPGQGDYAIGKHLKDHSWGVQCSLGNNAPDLEHPWDDVK
jgi:hypothetical protein